MEKGRDFLRSRVHNAAAQHKAFLDSLEDHARQAEDRRFRDLCNRHLGPMHKHQAMLEKYRRTLGGGPVAANAGRDAGDAPGQDVLRLARNLAMARQVEDTFRVFRDAGRALGEMELARIGEEGERDLDRYVEAANRLVLQLFVECAQEVPVGVR